MDILARREKQLNQTFKEQLLSSHLLTVAETSAGMARELGIENIAYLIGAFHDVGKSGIFQQMLRGEKIQVNHSTFGAYFLFLEGNRFLKGFEDDNSHFLFLNTLILPILQHHGLMDILPSIPKEEKGMRYYFYTLYRLDQKNRGEDIQMLFSYADHFSGMLKESFEDIVLKAYREWTILEDKVYRLTKGNPKSENSEIFQREINFYRSCIIRLLLSILKEADIYDSSNAFQEKRDPLFTSSDLIPIWESFYEKIETKASFFESKVDKSSIDIERNRLSKDCKLAGENIQQGTFTLELPTGAGKTISVMRFAMAQSRKFKKNRIFYTTAFLSVLEQNAEEIKNILDNSPYILEHHSNVIEDKPYIGFSHNEDENKDDINESSYHEYFKESWESPVILTTLVQMSNTLFGQKSSQLRRFSKLINSVIIMDEVQSLPLKAIYSFSLMTNFLSTIMNSTIIHCSATNPVYDNAVIEYSVQYSMYRGSKNLAKIDPSRLDLFNRVQFISLLGSSAEDSVDESSLVSHVLEEMNEAYSSLIICNKKKEVMDLFNIFSKMTDIHLVYLTTNLCPAHRLNKITKMKRILHENRQHRGKKLICISTQLVEAGVDLDFDLVYREVSGLDNVVQSAGRCNREGLRSLNGKKIKGKCFVFRLIQDDLRYLPEIHKAADAFCQSMRSMKLSGEFDPRKINSEFFTRYYVQNQGDMVYKIKGEKSSIIDYLSINPFYYDDLHTYAKAKNDLIIFSKQDLLFPYRQNFKSAAQAFHLIDEQGYRAVIVHYHNEDVLEKLYEADERKDYCLAKSLLHNISRWTIQVSEDYMYKNIEKFESLFDGEIFILQKCFYNMDFGYEPDSETEMLVF